MLDTSPKQARLLPDELGVPESSIGQLLTPLTRYSDRGGMYAIDNGAFSRFDAKGFRGLLRRQSTSIDRCKFVAAPDVVGSARRTLECFAAWRDELKGWPIALVAQDGQEDLDIPWAQIEAIFIGGSTEWKLGKHAAAIVRAAKVIGKWVHIGRVNTPERLDYCESIGADSVDGSGLAQYSHMRNATKTAGLFPKTTEAETTFCYGEEPLSRN